MFHFGIIPTRFNRVKLDWLDALIGGGFSLANSAMNNAWSLSNARQMADYNKDIAKELADYQFGLQKEGLDYSLTKDYQQSLLSDQQTPTYRRQGLELAGYNPILAVNSSAGQSFSNQISAGVPASGGTSAPTVRADVLGAIAAVSSIRQNDARTEFIKAQTDNTGWVVKTLSRSEAAGLGSNVLHMLGINLHESSANTFLVAYNTRTGEFRNLGDTRNGLGSTGEVTNASDVPEGVVDVSIESKDKDGSLFWKLLTDPPIKSPLR